MLNIVKKNDLFVVTVNGQQIYETWSHSDALDFSCFFMLSTGKQYVAVIAEA